MLSLKHFRILKRKREAKDLRAKTSACGCDAHALFYLNLLVFKKLFSVDNQNSITAMFNLRTLSM